MAVPTYSTVVRKVKVVGDEPVRKRDSPIGIDDIADIGMAPENKTEGENKSNAISEQFVPTERVHTIHRTQTILNLQNVGSSRSTTESTKETDEKVLTGSHNKGTTVDEVIYSSALTGSQNKGTVDEVIYSSALSGSQNKGTVDEVIYSSALSGSQNKGTVDEVIYSSTNNDPTARVSTDKRMGACDDEQTNYNPTRNVYGNLEEQVHDSQSMMSTSRDDSDAYGKPEVGNPYDMISDINEDELFVMQNFDEKIMDEDTCNNMEMSDMSTNSYPGIMRQQSFVYGGKL